MSPCRRAGAALRRSETPTNATLGTTTVHTVTITDDDATPTVAWSAASQSVGESLGTVTVTASLSAASGQTVTVPYTVTGTATPSVDYTLADGGPLTIAAGQTSANITFNVVNDALDETDETVIVTMGTPTNATLGTTTVHTATILDDDGVLSLLAGALGGPGNVDGTGADARQTKNKGRRKGTNEGAGGESGNRDGGTGANAGAGAESLTDSRGQSGA